MWRWRSRTDDDFSEEIHANIALNTDRFIADGMSPEEATRAALRAFGNVTRAQERFYESGRMIWLDDVQRDIRYACRTLVKNPGFSVVAVLTLALGIGATTAIYSVVNTVLLQPLPFPDSDRLVRVIENVPHVVAGRAPLRDIPSYQAFLEWRAHSKTLSDITAFTWAQRVVRTPEGVVRLWGGTASANAFRMLGTRAMLGRVFGPDDIGNPNVVVLSANTWRLLFQSDPAVVGTMMEFRGPKGTWPRMTIIGVLPAGFEFPAGPPVDFFTLFGLDDTAGRFSAAVIGRLGDGIPLQAAMDEAAAIGRGIPVRNVNAPPLSIQRFEVQNLKSEIVLGLRPALRVLLAAVAVVLMIVCANVANLLLARGTARQREIAVRFAVGGSRGRVVRQLLTECLVLAVAGGALGALFGAVGVHFVKELASVEAPGIFRFAFGDSILPRVNEIGIDLKMFGVAFGIAALTSLLFGILPALRLSQTNQLHATGLRAGGSGRRDSGVLAALVVGQVVLATVLLVAAGLLINSFIRLLTVEKGYDPSSVLVFQLVFPNDYSIARKTDAIEAVLARLRATPNVESAGFSRHGILIPEEIFVGTFVPQGRTLDEMRDDPVRPGLRAVSHGYLTAVGARLIAGRELEAADTTTSTPVIVISRAIARRYFGAGSAIGRFVDWYPGQGLPALQMQVVGVIEDVRNESPDREAHPEIFVDYRQLLALQQRWGRTAPQQDNTALGFLSFAVRTRGDPAFAAPAVGKIVRSIDANVGIDAMIPMDRLVMTSVARWRFYAVVVGAFAAVAGVLAAIGIYGVLAYAVMQRTQEIGIRMALGAQRAQVLTLVLHKGLILTTIGIALGLVGAVAGTRFLQGMLFGITPLDPKTFVVVSLMFVLVATFASYLPARRATKVDPMVALRCE